MVSAIPVGATLSDGANTFTATRGQHVGRACRVDAVSLTITPANDAISRWAWRRHEWMRKGNLSTTTTATEAVTVTPLAPTVAPVAETGVEGSAIALNLGGDGERAGGRQQQPGVADGQRHPGRRDAKRRRQQLHGDARAARR